MTGLRQVVVRPRTPSWPHLRYSFSGRAVAAAHQLNEFGADPELIFTAGALRQVDDVYPVEPSLDVWFAAQELAESCDG